MSFHANDAVDAVDTAHAVDAIQAIHAIDAAGALGDHHGALAYALGLAVTLVLASFLTPARWWRRPTVRGIAILGGGAWAGGALLLHVVAAAPAPAHAASLQVDAPAQHASPPPPVPATTKLMIGKPVPGQRYRVHRDLNVRASAGVEAARQATVPAGAIVTPTGLQEGDWWQIRYDGGRAGASGGAVGWASSLWLRRAAEP